uniref:Molybdopterin biosynthesis protein n=1 Tax=Ophidocladus simpliciusculus TaxID=1261574 RepID=A0A1Z1MJS3_9FLOR|nr:Molybdopterin biosynthesis protein [Ophidocladus simpliciusculus]ARW66075.1 Molybdopterin biosynthesis protein [Ophidocladus simpliciusculus]
MLNPKINSIELSNEEYLEYSKQLNLEHIKLEGQKRLKQVKILVIGAGGLGCPIMIYLVKLGIGCIGILDYDKIEYSNLNRQILYLKKDINNLKVISAQKKLDEISNSCKIITHLYKLHEKNSIELISYYDIIIDATDNFETRYIIDQTCYKLHKIHMYAAVEKFEGQIAIFNYKNGIRYVHLYPHKLNMKNKDCNSNGILGITTGYIGIAQAIETTKVILGTNRECRNYTISYKLLETEIKKNKIYISSTKKNKNYKDKKKFEINQKISHSKLNTLKNQSYKKTITIDLREANELMNDYINKSINIPIIKFKLNKTLKFIIKCSVNKIVILYCNKMNRSLIASHFLNNYKIEHYILKIPK